MKKTILTGLKPTGSLTLGNYIGSISQMVKMQDEYKSYLEQEEVLKEHNNNQIQLDDLKARFDGEVYL